MVTISTEEYVDLIRAQHTLEQLIALKENLVFSWRMDVFDAIAGKVDYATKYEKIAADTGKVNLPEEQIEEVWGKPHETV